MRDGAQTCAYRPLRPSELRKCCMRTDVIGVIANGEHVSNPGTDADERPSLRALTKMSANPYARVHACACTRMRTRIVTSSACMAVVSALHSRPFSRSSMLYGEVSEGALAR
eukprot:6198335-Pleurochrysis_carterae.AAC.2